ncbi:sulfotransferase [Ekhidna sp.]|uniref:sulfotransferase n=1 Tax=Ekhidna sp. TaxID=2608089 RepID=UPI003298ADDB
MSRKIIYIMGGGRSGTTLLDIILGNSNQAFSLGEILKFLELEGVPHNSQEGDEVWSFYQPIYQQLRNSTDLEGLSKIANEFEYHSNYLNVLFWLKSAKKKKLYANYVNKVFDILFEASKAEILIDSSKYPARAMALSKVLKHEIAFVYIQRDPVKVIESFGKKNLEQPSKSTFSAFIYYVFVNLGCQLSLRILKTRHSTIQIKYEDLVQSPSEVIELISNKLQIDADELITKLQRDEAIQVGKLFEGNRIRLKQEITIKRSVSSNEGRSLKQFIVRLLTKWIY